jgi:hypothetical protein
MYGTWMTSEDRADLCNALAGNYVEPDDDDSSDS